MGYSLSITQVHSLVAFSIFKENKIEDKICDEKNALIIAVLKTE